MSNDITLCKEFELPLLPTHVQQLSQELAKRKKRNPRYSLRAFAHALGLDPSALSRILAGKQEISLITTRKVLKALKLQADERLMFLTSVADEKKKKITAFLVQENVEAWRISALEKLADPVQHLKMKLESSSRIFIKVEPEKLGIVQDILKGFMNEISKAIGSISESPMTYEVHVQFVPVFSEAPKYMKDEISATGGSFHEE